MLSPFLSLEEPTGLWDRFLFLEDLYLLVLREDGGGGDRESDDSRLYREVGDVGDLDRDFDRDFRLDLWKEDLRK